MLYMTNLGFYGRLSHASPLPFPRALSKRMGSYPALKPQHSKNCCASARVGKSAQSLSGPGHEYLQVVSAGIGGETGVEVSVVGWLHTEPHKPFACVLASCSARVKTSWYFTSGG